MLLALAAAALAAVALVWTTPAAERPELLPRTAADAPLSAAHMALRRHLPQLRLDQLGRSQVPGLLQIELSDGVAYATADGRYFIKGELIDTATRQNLSEQRRRHQRRTLLASLGAGSTIDFSPAAPRHTIVVFTDVDCRYCRQFHQQVEELNRHGIAVRYAAFPRSGPATGTWKTMQSVWCAADRRQALSRAKRGEPVQPSANCSAAAIGQHYGLATRVGLKGTPFVVLEDGRVINGYLPAERLLRILAALDSEAVLARSPATRTR
jgi:thiol:disulfide interchange protein DsbC